MICSQLNEVQIKPPRAEFPMSCMAIGTLEVSRSCPEAGIDVPASAALIRHQGKLQSLADYLDECGVLLDGPEAIGDGEIGPLEIAKNSRKAQVGLLGENNLV